MTPKPPVSPKSFSFQTLGVAEELQKLHLVLSICGHMALIWVEQLRGAVVFA